MFIGREREMNALEKLYASNKFEFNVHLYLLSKAGFTKGCIDEATGMGNVTLVNYVDIVV